MQNNSNANVHMFKAKSYSGPTFCTACGKLLKGFRLQGLHCSICNANVHSRCMETCKHTIICSPAGSSRVLIHNSNAKADEYYHQFSPNTFMSPTKCFICKKVLLGLKRQGLQCAKCKLAVHIACKPTALTMKCVTSEVAHQRHHSSFSFANMKSSILGTATLQAAKKSSDRRINNKSKQNVDNMEISSPYDFQHDVHMEFEHTTGEFKGMPKTWSTVQGSESLIFGATVAGQPRMELAGYPERIPSILVLLAREIQRRHGFEVEGVFRIAPSRSEMSSIKQALNSGSGVSVELLQNCSDIHIFAALIKDWCRSLPGGSCVLHSLSPDIIKQLLADGAATEAGLPKVFSYLPEPNKSLFLWLVDLMAHVCEFQTVNLMGIKAISIVFAPSLFEPSYDLPALQSVTIVKDVTTVISNCVAAVIESGEYKARNTFGIALDVVAAAAAATEEPEVE